MGLGQRRVVRGARDGGVERPQSEAEQVGDEQPVGGVVALERPQLALLVSRAPISRARLPYKEVRNVPERSVIRQEKA